MTNEERETLVDIKKAAENGLSCISCGNDCISRLWQIVGLCDAAISKPQRNCDVGTAEEQQKRFDRFCERQGCMFGGDNANKCPLDPDVCEFAWAQMPYQKEVNNGDNGDSGDSDE